MPPHTPSEKHQRMLQEIRSKAPNLFIIGAPKCGTTSMHQYLKQHPQIFMSRIKEPHYFCDDLPGLRRFPGIDNYLNLFDDAKPNQVYRGESTSRYLYSDSAVANIRHFCPDARIIAMLRNPVDLVHSLHAQLLYQFFEDEQDFETAWRLQDDRKEGRRIPKYCPEPVELQYGRIAKTGQQIRRLFQTVSRDQVHLVFFDDFQADPKSVYQGVLDFLGLPDDQRTTFERANPHKNYRSDVLAKLLFDPPFPLRQIKHGLKKTFGWQETRLVQWASAILTVPTRRQELCETFRQELTEYFAADVELLESVSGRDLSHWRETSHRAAPSPSEIVHTSVSHQTLHPAA